MATERTRQRIARLVAPRLGATEEIVATGPAWVAPLRRRVPVLLVGRTLHLVALTDRRLLIFRRRRPRKGGGELALAKSLALLRVVRMRRWLPMMALRIEIGDGRVLLLELRPHDRALGRSIAEAIGAAAAVAVAEAPGGDDASPATTVEDEW